MTLSPAKMNEYEQAEYPARSLLEQLGWTYVPRADLTQERGNEREVLLKGRLVNALQRINEWMTSSQARRVIHDLESIDESGMARNQRVHEYLTYGMPLTVNGGGAPRTRIVHFFDFEHPEGGKNEFVVTTQFRVRRGDERGGLENDERMVIPDLVLFVNGIPLVVMEAKSPSLMGVWKSQAVDQLRRYQEADPKWHGAGAPALFHYNLLCVAHCGAAAAYATYGAPENAYVEWKSVLPYSDDEVRQQFGLEPQGQSQLIIGLLSPATLLDVLRDYVVYEPERGRVVKKVPRYQQYRAVRAALQRMLEGERPAERGGVVWHTQGSGKSLTMLWLATKLRRDPRLESPAIVVVTDRTQLDRQISATFERCGFPAPERAATTAELRQLLSSESSRTVMTTIQKFEDALGAPDGRLELLNPSQNVVLMVDEAHRTQYGLLGAKMSDALPNATMVGFTGTPIDLGFKRSTMLRFGPIIDSYTIPESVADGATVPIYYEARLAELAIEGPNTLDKLFDAIFGDMTEDERELIRRRYANKETVAEAEERIQMIALDIHDHFRGKIRPNGFKAQVVAPSRAAALKYAQHLRDFGLSAFPIITTSPQDGSEFNPARELNQQQIINEFVDPFGEPEVLVVVDMLLTGFDAPIEQVLYLDRRLRQHGLLQAIARVNRRCSIKKDGVDTEKSYGLIVDYHGISRELEVALSEFQTRDVQDVMREVEHDPTQTLETAAANAESHFGDHDVKDTWQCVSVFAGDGSADNDFDAERFERFNADYREFSRLIDRHLPDRRVLPFVDRLARLTEIRVYVRAQHLREDAGLNWTDIGAKVKQLVDQRISAEIRPLMRPVSILDSDFEAKIADIPHDEAQARTMQEALKAEIQHRIPENPAFYEKLSAQLARIIEELRAQIINSAEACKQMLELRRQIQQEADFAAEHGLSPVSLAIYELLDNNSEESESQANIGDAAEMFDRELDEEKKSVSMRVEEIIGDHLNVVDWRDNHEVQRIIRRDIKRELRQGGEYSETELDELANRIIGIAISRDDRI